MVYSTGTVGLLASRSVLCWNVVGHGNNKQETHQQSLTLKIQPRVMTNRLHMEVQHEELY